MNIASCELHTKNLNTMYLRGELKSRIVHLGFGAFHRAHQALITHEMLAQHGGDWGICEVNLFGGEELIRSLRTQDHLYTVLEKGAESAQPKVIGSVVESLHPTFDGMSAILEKMAEPQVAIVSMTITEKGYCADPATGQFNPQNPLIQHDLQHPDAPTSAIGCIVASLRLRKERGLPPFTVMSCDNVQENGHVARQSILGFAELLDGELASWIREQVTFPCTMVDRIVPAATPETLIEIEQAIGVYDPCGIACEPFRQWVIEDNFVNGRPNWDLAGAEFVSNVVPFEEMKLRMLNGSHSFLAYLGYLGGYAHIADTMTNPAYRQAALDLMLNEQAPTLNMPVGTDLDGYAQQLIARFTNPSLKHQTWQIAMDGSQKLPQRMVDSVLFHLKNGSDYRHLALGIAGWMRYVSGEGENGEVIDVRDPLLNRFQAIYAEHGLSCNAVKPLLAIEAIFGPELPQQGDFVDAVTQAYQGLLDHGARHCVAAL
ncbi:fructuronate reductase [Aeromonas caviae]|uniref:fructuronate reductase n=1 Tax=Aeromonas caviae TaxID=648 RepID=UPI00214E54D0|nr:fructuronate reductase [Aeromonas caviae]MCR3893874.1 fructuronate reductase [Aeromonas caviae]